LLIPLSTLQQSTVEWICAGGGSSFGINVSLSLRLRGAVSKSALDHAIAFVMRRHEGLRTRIYRADGRLLQYFADPADSFNLAVVSVASLAEAEAHIAMRLASRLDLESSGPLSAELLKLSEQDHILLLILNHTATDTHADDLFITEILTAYDCYVRGVVPLLPPAMSFSEYITGEIEAGDRLTEAQLQYWGEVIRGCIPAIPQRDRCSGAGTASCGRIICMSTTAEATQRLEQFASALKVSLMAVLTSVIFLAVGNEFALEDVCAFATYAGKDSIRLKTLGASCGRDFLIRIALSKATSLSHLAKLVQTALIRSSILSRPPFTHDRALAQLSEQGGSGQQAATEAIVPPRVHLAITDALRIKRSLQSFTPQLLVERVMPGPLLNDPFQISGADVPYAGLLNILLRRDLSPEPGEPITFVGIFIDDFVEENVVRRFLKRICDVAELVGRESQYFSSE
jgi:hypothetical protein